MVHTASDTHTHARTHARTHTHTHSKPSRITGHFVQRRRNYRLPLTQPPDTTCRMHSTAERGDLKQQLTCPCGVAYTGTAQQQQPPIQDAADAKPPPSRRPAGGLSEQPRVQWPATSCVMQPGSLLHNRCRSGRVPVKPLSLHDRALCPRPSSSCWRLRFLDHAHTCLCRAMAGNVTRRWSKQQRWG
jgi:hypothetical protein